MTTFKRMPMLYSANASYQLIDNFDRADGAIGNQWSAGTIANGKAVIIPTESAEKGYDPGLEAWTTASDLTQWTENKSGTETFNQDGADKHGGSYSCRIDLGAAPGGANNSKLTQTSFRVVQYGLWKLSVWCKATDPSVNMAAYNGVYSPLWNAATWTNKKVVWYAPTTAPNVLIGHFNNGENKSIWLDDISVKDMTWASLFSLRPAASKSNGVFTAKVAAMPDGGVWCGVVTNLNSTSTPTNCLLFYLDSDYFYVSKLINGQLTNLVKNRVDFVANAEIKVVKQANQLMAYYDGVAQSVVQTVDAAIKDNLLFGLFSTDAECTYSQWTEQPTDSASITDPYITANGGAIYCLGDSKTAGDGDTTGTDGTVGYPWILKKKLSRANNGYWSEITPRRGIGGITVHNMLTNLPGYLAGTTGTPTHVLINLGTNDTAVDDPGKIATWKSEYGQIIDLVHTKWASAKIYLAYPMRNTVDAYWDDMAGWIDEVIAAHAPYTYTGADERVFLRPNYPAYFADAVHPNYTGYTATAEAWRDAILS